MTAEERACALGNCGVVQSCRNRKWKGRGGGQRVQGDHNILQLHNAKLSLLMGELQ